jgi:hypothetical protein
MPLGLDQLTGDQLLELVLEVSQELARRDPYLRNMAQATITTEAERLELKRLAIKEAAGVVVREYVEGVRLEAIGALKEGFRNGTARILTSTQEARIVVEATLEAKIKLVEETVAAIQAGKAPTAVKPEPGGWKPEQGNQPPSDFEGYQIWREANRTTPLDASAISGMNAARAQLTYDQIRALQNAGAPPSWTAFNPPTAPTPPKPKKP